MMERKLLLIGLDGGTFNILEPLAKRGIMPFFAHIMDKGTIAPLRSTIPFISPTAWCSFITGKNPGKHGVFDFRTKYKGTYDFETNIPNIPKRGTIWQYISTSNISNLIFNIPMTYPPQPIKGYMVAGFGTPGIESEFTYPDDLKKEIIEKFDYVLDVHWAKKDVGQEKELMDEITQMTKTKFEVVNYLMKKSNFDFVALGLISTDRIQHRLYNYISKYLNNGGDLGDNVTGKILDHYAMIDKNLKDFYETGGFSDIMVMSDHGFGPCNHIIDLNKIFSDKGWIEFQETFGKDNRYLNIFKKFVKKFGITGHNLRKLLRKTNLDALGSLNKMLHNFEPIKWEKTKVFSVTTYGIYLNLKGREPQGTIRNSDYESMRDEVINTLLAYRYQNKQVFYKIYKKEEIYNGDYLEVAPDLVIGDFDTNVQMGSFTGPDSESQIKKFHAIYPGSHTIDGIFIASGDNFIKTKFSTCPQITDLMPTILAYFGVPVPEDVDGRVLEEIFKLKPNIRETGGLQGSITDDDNYTREEKDKVIDQLKGLGYI